MRRNRALDGLRALAVLGVVAFHMAGDIARGGFLGVSVFFVLSGYLITTLLLAERARTGSIDLRAFYLRRALRLYPALVVAVVLAAVLGVVATGSTSGDVAASSAGAMTYVTDITEAAGAPVGLLGHTWSLAIEEQFYILWPLALILLARRKWVLRGALAAVAAATLVTAALHPAIGRVSYFLPWTHVCGLLLGAALAVRRPRIAPAAAVLALAVLLVAMATVAGPFWTPLYFGGWLAVSLLAAVLIASTTTEDPGRLQRGLASRPAVWLGRRSYGVYLFSAPITEAVNRELHASLRLRGLVVAVATLLIAEASYRWVESPFLRRKERYQPLTQREKAAAVVAAA